MKIEDLRIGNIVFCDEKNIIEIDAICSYEVNRLDCSGGFDYNEISGVEINKKILLQCGFYKENNYTSNDNVFVKEIRFPSYFTIVEEEKGYKLCDVDIYTNIIYLHELQNLYYALTKIELPIDINTLEL